MFPAPEFTSLSLHILLTTISTINRTTLIYSSSSRGSSIFFPSSMEWRHLLLVTHPVQGHINPSLQFASRLVRLGAQVTFITTLYAHRRMLKAGGGRPMTGITFAPFSDGNNDEGLYGDHDKFMEMLKTQGSKALRDTITTAADDGRPVTCVVHTIALAWVVDVAREMQVTSALLWIQPATVLNVYNYYFHDLGREISENISDHEWRVKIPGAPPLSKRDLPSFILPSSPEIYRFLLTSFKDEFGNLDSQENPKILVNTFNGLEDDAINAISKYELIAIGPLIPFFFLDCKSSNPSDSSFSGDLFQKPEDDDYIQWLNSKPEASVVYVSFGSLVTLSRAQMEEIGKGLVACGRPFLWVKRLNLDQQNDCTELSCWEELRKVGKTVPWCSQVEVLKHPSLGCFVSHCGWNSTLESMSCGVPMVAFPQWTDQGTNAKLIEDVWGIGVRVMRGGKDGDDLVESGELKRCIEEVMDAGDKSRWLRENAAKWKRLAREAMDKEGPSNLNLRAFLQLELGC